MRLTVLADNNTYIDQYYLGEPALSFYLENKGRSYLFDAGYSDVYRKNAAALGVDLSELDAVIISHGHDDHTGGLAYFPKRERKPLLVAHPGILESKRADGLSISLPVSENFLRERFSLRLTEEPLWLDEEFVFLGKIPRLNDFENLQPVGERYADGAWQADYVWDDSALAYKSAAGLCIITGCSHAGICNIVEYAKKITSCTEVRNIIGGLHLFSATSAQALRSIAYLKSNVRGTLYPCHCTNLAAKAALWQNLPVAEAGVGLRLEWQGGKN